jgi:hypothetical protein
VPLYICGCMKPVNLPDMMCGRCGLRRIGDDLTPEQLQVLTDTLSAALVAADGDRRVLLKRVKGRKRPRDRSIQ